MTSNIKCYFDQRANRYRADSASPLWNWQRQREVTGVSSLLSNVCGRQTLDLGCGAGHYTRLLLNLGARHVTSVDFSPEMLKQLPTDNVTGVLGDAATADPGKRFAVIVSAGLLEFVDDPETVLTNARRLVENGGCMVCLVPPDSVAGNLYRLFHRRHGFDITLFSRATFTRTAEDAGWKVEARKTVFPYALVFRLSAP